MAGNTRNKRKSAGLRNKMHSKTPVTIRYTSEEDRNFKVIPHLALKALSDGSGNGREWYSFTFRLNVGLQLESSVKTDSIDILEKMMGAIFVSSQIEERFIKNQVWDIPEQDIVIIETALTLVDAMQDKTTRYEQLLAFKDAQAFMKTKEKYLCR